MEIDYTIVFSKRKTLSLLINRQGQLVVRAPAGVHEEVIEKAVQEKSNWIQRHLQKYAGIKHVRKYETGEEFWYLGKQYPLVIVPEFRTRLVFENAFLISKFSLSKAKKLFEDWYKKQAREVLLERSKKYSEIMDVKFSGFSITGASTRWGSCSSQGSINFSYRLVMAPLWIIDYVVIHELSHLVHHNHSMRFWRLVETHYPEYKLAKKWLRDNSHILALP